MMWFDVIFLSPCNIVRHVLISIYNWMHTQKIGENMWNDVIWCNITTYTSTKFSKSVGNLGRAVTLTQL